MGAETARDDADAGVPMPLSRREFRMAFAGLMLVLAFATLDGNIVGPALPRIVGELGGLEHLSWVLIAYLLTSTATTPLYGKLSDLYGRIPLFTVSILLFLAGSAFCGLARDMTELIVGRAIQGLGGGGLAVLSQTTIADLVTPRERGRYQGLFGVVFALCSVIGPPLGGLITEAASWRWIFFVNIPVGVGALAMLWLSINKPRPRVAHRIDYLGALVLTGGTSCLLLVLSWGGLVYPWGSPVIVMLGIAAVVLLVLLVGIERKAAEPLIAIGLFNNPAYIWAAGASALSNTALFGALAFLPLFLQMVLGVSPTESGLMTLPLVAGIVSTMVVAGRRVSKTGRYKGLAVGGIALSTLALGGMTLAANLGAGIPVILVSLAFIGAGIGVSTSPLTVSIQNAVGTGDVGAATATAAFLRQLGTALGVAISGAVLAAGAAGVLPQDAGKGMPGATPGAQGLEALAHLPAAERLAVIATYRDAIVDTFTVGVAISVVSLLLVLMLQERPLRAAPHPGAEPRPAEAP